MKYRIAFSILIVIALSACAPSVEAVQTSVAITKASYTATPTPTSTPTSTLTAIPSPTKDLEFEYLSQFIGFMNQWSDGYQKMQNVNQRIKTDGMAALTSDTAFQADAALAIVYLEGSSQKMVELQPPSSKFQQLQQKAKELSSSSVSFKNLFLLGMSGDQLSYTLAQKTLQETFATFTELANEITALTTNAAPLPTNTSIPTSTIVAIASSTSKIPVVIIPQSTQSSGHPAGTSGQCADGTFTSAQHKQGACSHHGGVSIWWGP